MNTNWKTLAEKENAKAYVLPDGWDSRDAVAAQLDCSPEKVDDHLRPALKSGKVVKQHHRIWDSSLKRVVTIIAYRDASKDVSASSPDIQAINELKLEGKSWSEIGAAMKISGDRARGLWRRAQQ